MSVHAWQPFGQVCAYTCCKLAAISVHPKAAELRGSVSTYCVALSAPALRRLVTISSRPASRSTETNSMRGSLCSSTGGRRETAIIFIHSEELVFESASSKARPDTLVRKKRSCERAARPFKSKSRQRQANAPVRAKDKCSAHIYCIAGGIEAESEQSLQVAASAISFSRAVAASRRASNVDVNASSWEITS